MTSIPIQPLPSDNTAYGLSVKRTDDLLASISLLEELQASRETAIIELELRILALQTNKPRAPGPVENLSFSNVTSSGVEITWTNPSQGGTHTKTYLVYNDSNIPPVDPATGSIELDNSDTSHIVQLLEPGTPYYVFIYAHGIGGYSSETTDNFTTLGSLSNPSV
jgi:hypothetical protein